MLNISSSQPMGWPSAPPASVAPVQAVSGVGAAPAVPKESQSDTGSGSGSSPGRHGQAAQAAPVQASPRAANDTAAAGGTGTQASPQAAPLLPRERQRGQGATPLVAGETEESNLSTELRQEEDKKAREKAEQQIKLQEVLATVWKASAAVVDVVLGRDAAEAAAAAAEGKVDAVSSSAQVAAVGGAPASVDDPWATPEQADLLPSAWRREQDPEAYTEQGVGSWSPRETGLLISHRV